MAGNDDVEDNMCMVNMTTNHRNCTKRQCKSMAIMDSQPKNSANRMSGKRIGAQDMLKHGNLIA